MPTWNYKYKASPLGIACRASHTVLPHVLKRIEFWFFLGIHLALHGLHFLGVLHGDGERIDWNDAKIVTAVAVFFVCFYTNHCYTQYERLRQLTRSTFGAVYDFAFNMRLFVRPTGQPYDRVACRWVIVSLLLSLYEASGKSQVDVKEWNSLFDLGLVKDDEIQFLQGLSSQQRTLVMLHAASDCARVGLAEANAPQGVQAEISSSLLKYRGLQQELQGLLEHPAPFRYFQLLNLVVSFDLLVLAYAMATSGCVFAPVLYLIAELIFLGLLVLAGQLVNPLDKDEMDFPLSFWAMEFLQNTTALLDYEHGGAADDFKPDVEEEANANTRLRLHSSELESILGFSGVPAARLPEGGGRPLLTQEGSAQGRQQREVALDAGHAQRPPQQRGRGGYVPLDVRGD